MVNGLMAWALTQNSLCLNHGTILKKKTTLLATPMRYGSSWTRDGTRTTAATQAGGHQILILLHHKGTPWHRSY